MKQLAGRSYGFINCHLVKILSEIPRIEIRGDTDVSAHAL